MSSDDNKTETTSKIDENNEIIQNDASENIEERSLTMMDILKEENECETECDLVLGASDDKNCTYAKGYIKRQALYSCLTCNPEARTDILKSAGVCLACSYNCHELIELYTKRNFQCDCGNPKMINTKCTLNPTKCTENELNQYNQNFSGKYCYCHRPYPDPDDSIEDEMIQCIICEDWYHTRHLDASVPKIHNYSEMICGICMNTNEFLKSYTKLMVDGSISSNDDEDDMNVDDDTDKPDDVLKDEMNQCVLDIINMNKDQEIKPQLGKHKPTTSGTKSLGEPSEKKIILTNENNCIKPIIPSTYEKGATFWCENWRNHLCKCSDCKKLYETLKVEFLLDSEDTVQSYEEKGKNKKKETQYERGLRALSELDHTKQIDVISGYNKMKEKLMEFLQSFVINGKVVTEDDINSFFSKMKNEKTKNNVQPAYFCR